ncbi:signal peptidase I [Streptomyces sp. NPDC051940]|uniref:signal peptidase I n=1 Tax=Streptomyces sp. NPDC051940 TaxID=3155675 RepID=UPI00342FED58
MAVGARSGQDEFDDRSGSEEPVTEPAGVTDGEAAGVDEDDEETPPQRQHRSFWKELPILIGVALVLALLIKTFLLQAFSIPSDSMQNTLQRGDRILVDKLTPWFGSEPERGEVVVFHDPGNWLPDSEAPDPNAIQKVLGFIGLYAEGQDLVKRVIAVGGDTVECHGNGPVKVNGVALDESSYVTFPGTTPCADRNFGPLKVPEGKIWVMGDHRNDSLDSRYHMDQPGGGFVDNDEVVGRAIVRAWPISRWGTLPIPDTYDQPGINNQSASSALGAAPGVLGLAGAVPLVLIRRRRLVRRMQGASGG